MTLWIASSILDSTHLFSHTHAYANILSLLQGQPAYNFSPILSSGWCWGPRGWREIKLLEGKQHVNTALMFSRMENVFFRWSCWTNHVRKACWHIGWKQACLQPGRGEHCKTHLFYLLPEQTGHVLPAWASSKVQVVRGVHATEPRCTLRPLISVSTWKKSLFTCTSWTWH